jgi:predicted lipoprotein with Yx(FWY)xxD motif
MFLKRHLLTSVVPLLLLALLLAACGNASTTTNSASTSTTASAPTATPTTASAQTATPTTASSSGAVVQTASATVGGKTVTILTDTKGLTLYYRTSDTATSVCSGGCAQAWPPLLFSGSGTPTSATSLPGTLSVMTNANGTQVAYQGHLLYTFASDTAPGQTSGQGVGNVWFAATTDLKAVGGSGGGTTPTPTSGY